MELLNVLNNMEELIMNELKAIVKLKNNKKEVNFNQISPDCGDGPCPAVYLTDEGDYIFQGYKMEDCDRKLMNMANHETSVLIPKDVIENLFNRNQ